MNKIERRKHFNAILRLATAGTQAKNPDTARNNRQQYLDSRRMRRDYLIYTSKTIY